MSRMKRGNCFTPSFSGWKVEDNYAENMNLIKKRKYGRRGDIFGLNPSPEGRGGDVLAVTVRSLVLGLRAQLALGSWLPQSVAPLVTGQCHQIETTEEKKICKRESIKL